MQSSGVFHVDLMSVDPCLDAPSSLSNKLAVLERALDACYSTDGLVASERVGHLTPGESPVEPYYNPTTIRLDL